MPERTAEAMVVPPKAMVLPDIKRQVDPRAFDRSLSRGSLYIARDLLQVMGAYYAVEAVVPTLRAVTGVGWLDVALVLVAWAVYGFIQGLNFTALWVMAHECGHQAFSPYRTLNDAVGYIIHSALVVPYHSWRISHAAHHKSTNHLTKDTVYVPVVRDGASVQEGPLESPVASVRGVLGMLLLGWPLYLFTNATGQRYGQRANHFEPWSPIFRGCHRASIVLSDVGVLAAMVALVTAAGRCGWVAVWCHYAMPYLWLNAWLIGITYLQHSDTRLPHYTAEEWTFVRGALATADRDFGAIINGWLHHINDSHVAHHLFSTMPFYHAVEVTKALPSIFGDWYVRDSKGIVAGLWESWRRCRFVVVKEGIAQFRH